MNVLVYAGNGTTAESVKHCIESLRLHLSPYYAVVSVSESAILNDPWMNKTSLLVLTGGADLPYCRSLNGEGNRKIAQFVRKGGKFIGFCAGGYYASGRCEFEVGNLSMEVSGSRELRFFPGIARGCVYPGFTYNSHSGARATPLRVNNEVLPNVDSRVINYYNGGGYFVNASKYLGVQVLASYEDPLKYFESEHDRAAVIYCKVGNGDVILTGCHPEFTPSLLKPEENAEFNHAIEVLRVNDLSRRKFLQNCLMKLGLRVNKDVEVTVPRITPIYLSSYMNQSLIIETLDRLKQNLDIIHGNTWEDTNDTFCLHKEDEDDHEYFMESGEGQLEHQNANEAIKHLKVFTSKELPGSKETPYFNMQAYFNELEALWRNSNSTPGAIGALLGYGEVVSSTNTLLDNNTRWLSLLPHGTTLTATTQVAGRGRGGNLWINPKGVMATSILFKMPPGNNQTSTIVTLQYMCSLALIELILNYGEGYQQLPVKLKWPNDIYILKPEYFNSLDDANRENPETVDGDEEMFAKVSGAIVNSQFLDKQFHLVWGAGVNVSNEAPTTSLNIVLAKMNEIRKRQGLPILPPYRHELLLARVVFMLENYFNAFKKSGLEPFLSLYYKRWFHSNQTVRLETGQGTRKCIIRGITKDYGLLVAEDVNSGERFELQPDGNSFDIFKGLVYKKSV